MSFLYSVITFPVSLVYALVLLCSEKGRLRLKERFGVWGELPGSVLWFHAASVGEVQGLVPVIEELRKGLIPPVFITVTSTTALVKAQEITPFVRLLPFDSLPWIILAIEKIKIQLLVVTETEIWPALFSYLASRQIPIVMMNARVSSKKVSRYSLLAGMLPGLFHGVQKVLCVDAIMLSRFAAIGVPAPKLELSGNTKYCRAPLSRVKGELVQHLFEEQEKLVVIGNLRPGEEAMIFPAIKNYLSKAHAPLFAVVPRHPDKFEWFAEKLRTHGVPFVRWSEELKVPRGSVLFVDTFGVLERLYADAAGAVVCGSLVNYGGHNPLEPAPYMVAVAIGPYTDSSGGLVPLLEKEGCIDRVSNQIELEIFFDSVREGSTVAMASKLRAFWQRQQHSIEQVTAVIKKAQHG